MRTLRYLTFLSLLASCSVYDPALLQQGPVSDGGSDMSQPDIPNAACALRRPPEPPTVADSGEGAETLVFALKEVVLNQDGERWRQIGFDLDGLCTLPEEPEFSCVPPMEGASPEIDGAQGIDNSFGNNIFPIVLAVLSDLPAVAQQQAELGLGALILRVHDYNGEDNDPRVTVDLSVSLDATASDAAVTEPPAVRFVEGEAQTPGGDALPDPMWNGADWIWARDDGFLVDDVTRPRIEDTTAYVRDSIVVFRLPPRATISFEGDSQSVQVKLTDGIVTASLSPDRQRIMPAVIGGRWAINDLLDTAERIGVCPGTSNFNLMQTVLNSKADVRSEDDGGRECNAVTIGVTFTGYRTRFAGLAPAPTAGNACAE